MGVDIESHRNRGATKSCQGAKWDNEEGESIGVAIVDHRNKGGTKPCQGDELGKRRGGLRRGNHRGRLGAPRSRVRG